MVGGSGPKRTLRTAARCADAVNLWGPLEMVQQSLKTLQAHCRDAGRDPAEIRVTVFLPLAGAPSDTKAIVRRFLDAGFDDFIATPLAKPDFDAIRRFAEEVIPAFQ
jgi:alkanesulfonate monooxygenase SsuD/methylene tetrahydromethanopterin reductase-like flavin-dependent oxidoreductase (luciferase family)